MTPLERHRKAAGLTLEAFAERLGVSRQRVWSWETGRTEPTPDMYPRIAEVLRITPLQATELIVPSTPTAAPAAA